VIASALVQAFQHVSQQQKEGVHGILSLSGLPGSKVSQPLHEAAEKSMVGLTNPGESGKLIGAEIPEQDLNLLKLIRPALLVVVPNLRHQLTEPAQETIQVELVLQITAE
jgi:hypothetical protein